MEALQLAKITKISATILIFYILFYLQVWGDNHLILYGSAMLTGLSMMILCFQEGYLDFSYVPFGVWNNLIMVVYSLLTGIIVAYNYSMVVSSSITFAAYSIVCIAVCYVSAEENSFDWILRVLILLALVCSIYAFFQGTIIEGYGKTLSRANNPHVFAAVMNLGIFSVTYLENKDGKRKSLFSVLSVFLICFFYYSIIECGSRKYLIASGILVGIWVLASLRVRWNKGDLQQRIILVLICCAAIAIIFYYYRFIYMNSYTYLRMSTKDDAGNQNRIEFYQKAFAIYMDHPIFGGGYDQFRYWAGTGGYSHSTYAEAIADFGSLGCLIYFSPILYTTVCVLRGALKVRDYHSNLLVALCIVELFLGVGQIFFMEFYHFLAWMIIFYFTKELIDKEKELFSEEKVISKYIRV